jgi:peptide/nickel transport system permease protein
LPIFIPQAIAMMLFGVTLGWLPLSGLHSFHSYLWPWWQQVLDAAWHLVLPISVGIMGAFAGLSRYMRSSMIDALQQDYITTARAKGQKEGWVVYRHALKNALLPVITILGLAIPGLIGGSVIIESLFAIPGMGKLFYDAVMMRDYPLIMAVLTLGAVLTLVGNLLADLAYALADPRIRHQ